MAYNIIASPNIEVLLFFNNLQDPDKLHEFL